MATHRIQNKRTQIHTLRPPDLEIPLAETFVDDLIEGTKLRLRLSAAETQSWSKAVRFVQTIFVRSHFFRSPIQTRSALRKLIQAIDSLETQRALFSPFYTQTDNQLIGSTDHELAESKDEKHDSNELIIRFMAHRLAAADGYELNMPVPSFGFSSYISSLRRWATENCEQRAHGGKIPHRAIDGAIRDLLILYWHGFGEKPSLTREGPTVRFIEEWFKPIHEFNKGRSRTARYPCPDTPEAIRGKIGKQLSEVSRLTEVPRWWEYHGLSRPVFLLETPE